MNLIARLTKEAKKSNHRFQVACAIKFISSDGGIRTVYGYNRSGAFLHPFAPHPFRTIHAEFDAYGKVWPGSVVTDVYVLRLSRKYGPRMAKPCKYCAKFLLSKLDPMRIWYTNGSGMLERLR